MKFLMYFTHQSSPNSYIKLGSKSTDHLSGVNIYVWKWKFLLFYLSFIYFIGDYRMLL